METSSDDERDKYMYSQYLNLPGRLEGGGGKGEPVRFQQIKNQNFNSDYDDDMDSYGNEQDMYQDSSMDSDDGYLRPPVASAVRMD